QCEQGHQAQGGQGAGHARGADGEAFEPAGVADVQPDGHGDQRRDQHAERGVAEMLGGAQRDPGRPGPARRLGEPLEGSEEGVLVPGRPPSRPRCQGISRRPSSASSASVSSARAAVATTPAAISATIPRRTPSTNSIPRLGTPSTPPTVTSEIVLTATTRTPPSSTGPASGSSTCQKRATGAKPCAVAE